MITRFVSLLGRPFGALGVLVFIAGGAWAVPGDVNNDTFVNDLDRQAIQDHLLNRVLLTGPGLANADVNSDGQVNVLDLLALYRTVLPTELDYSSPASGEGDVALSRSLAIHFTAPLNPSTVNSSSVYARFGTTPEPAWVHVSPDAMTVTLFFQSLLPSSASIKVTIDGDALVDSRGGHVDADGDGARGGKRYITFSTLSTAPVAGTKTSGRVFASELASDGSGGTVNTPLQNVRIAVDGDPTMFTITDLDGNFTLDPAPAGPFFVQINGHNVTTALVDGVPTPTKYPQGPYYPFVGKQWTTKPGEELNVGDIYLPLVPVGSLQATSMTDPTVITFPPSVLDAYPELAGVQITVPPDTVYSNNNQRGGMVGIAPVSPDRLPTPLPVGLNLPLVITVQTDGPTNFDKPVPACFPNLPDPISGETLPPGAKSALWSFDHEAGRFVVIGPMTVTADGKFVCTDPGVGILKPGWHGSGPGSGPGPGPGSGPGGPGPGPGPGPPPPNKCKVDGLGCGLSVFLGALDCGASFIPGLAQFSAATDAAKCGFGVGTGIVATARDCLNPGSDNIDCGVSAGANALGIGAGCIASVAKAVPVLGSVIACGSALFSIGKSCTCIGRDKGNFEKSAQDDEVLTKTLAVLQAYVDMYNLYFGDSKWTSFDPTIGDPYKTSDEAMAIFFATYHATGDFSPGGRTMTPEEIAAIQALPVPAPLGPSDVNNLISYVGRTVDFWAQGKFTHAQAGESDFVDEDQVRAAMDTITAAFNALEATGAPEFDFPGTLNKLYYDTISNFADASSSFPVSGGKSANKAVQSDPTSDYFVLVNQNNLFTLRGHLTASGGLNIGALAPNTYYRAAFYDPKNNSYARLGFLSAGNGKTTWVPNFLFLDIDGETDTDGDGLPDLAEEVIGTDPNNVDSNNDGITDGAAVEQGLDPLAGVPSTAGILATAAAPGPAIDVAANSDIVALAESGKGISIYNVFNGMAPKVMAQLPTPGGSVYYAASAVACSPGYVAVADGPGGLDVIDVSDPPNAYIKYQVTASQIHGIGTSVATSGTLAFVATDSGWLTKVDMVSGLIVDQVQIPPQILDICVDGRTLYLVTPQKLSVVPLDTLTFGEAASVAMPSGWSQSAYRSRIFTAGGTAYVSQRQGYITFDVSNRLAPSVLISTPSSGQFGWKQIVLNGSGLGICAVGNNSTGDGAQNIDLYDTSDPHVNTNYIATFEIPGVARSATLYNGLAYVASYLQGLTVLNYLPYDTHHTPPTVSFTASDNAGDVISNQHVFVEVDARDDVQVRNVTLLVDGQAVARDGNYPFQFTFDAPSITTQPTVTINVVASDTGGNSTTGTSQTLSILPDTTGPVVSSTSPRAEGLAAELTQIVLYFDEPIDATAVSVNGLTVTNLGANGVPGGGDDTTIPVSSLDTSEDKRLLLSFDAPLQEGLYTLVVSPSTILDLSGNPMAAPFTLHFGCNGTPPAGTTNYWTNLSNGTWSDVSNWSSGQLPIYSDNLWIHVPTGLPTVTVSTGNQSVNTLILDGNLVLSGGELDIYDSAMVNGTLDISGNATLHMESAATTFTVTGAVTANYGTISINAGTVSLPGLTTASYLTLWLTGLLDVPNLTSLDHGTVYAYSSVNAPKLATFTNSTYLGTSGSNLSFPALTSVADTLLDLDDGSTLHLAALTTYANTSLKKLQLTGTALLDAPLLTTFTNVTIECDTGSHFTTPSGAVFNMTLDTGGTFFQANGGTIDASNLADGQINVSCSSCGSTATSFIVYPNGSLDLSGLTTLDWPGKKTIYVQQTGQLLLPNVTHITTADIQSNYAGAMISLPKLTGLSGPGSRLYCTSGGAISAPMLTSLDQTDISCGGALTLDALTSVSGAMIQVSTPYSLNLPAVTTFVNNYVTLNDMTTLSLPLVTSINNTAYKTLNVTGSVTLTMPVVSMTNMSIVVGANTTLSLPLMTSYTWSVAQPAYIMTTSGANSTLSLPNLAMFTLNTGVTGTSFMTSSYGGLIDMPALTTIVTPGTDSLQLAANGASTSINAPLLVTYDSGKVSFAESNGGTVTHQ